MVWCDWNGIEIKLFLRCYLDLPIDPLIPLVAVPKFAKRFYFKLSSGERRNSCGVADLALRTARLGFRFSAQLFSVTCIQTSIIDNPR